MILVFNELCKNENALKIKKNVCDLLPSDAMIVSNETVFRSLIMKNQYNIVLCLTESYAINQYIKDLFKNNQIQSDGTFFYIKDQFIEITQLSKEDHYNDIEKITIADHHMINEDNFFLNLIYPKSETIFLKELKGVWRTINHKNILCIEGKDVTSLIYTSDGQMIEVSTAQRNIMNSLPSYFVRAHRSFYVNKNHISEIKKSFLHLSNGFMIPFSKNYSPQFATVS